MLFSTILFALCAITTATYAEQFLFDKNTQFIHTSRAIFIPNSQAEQLLINHPQIQQRIKKWQSDKKSNIMVALDVTHKPIGAVAAIESPNKKRLILKNYFYKPVAHNAYNILLPYAAHLFKQNKKDLVYPEGTYGKPITREQAKHIEEKNSSPQEELQQKIRRKKVKVHSNSTGTKTRLESENLTIKLNATEDEQLAGIKNVASSETSELDKYILDAMVLDTIIIENKTTKETIGIIRPWGDKSKTILLIAIQPKYKSNEKKEELAAILSALSDIMGKEVETYVLASDTSFIDVLEDAGYQKTKEEKQSNLIIQVMKYKV